MKKTVLNGIVFIIILLLVSLVITASVLGPAEISKYYDSAILDEIKLESKGEYAEGYKYILNMDEKLYILSNALNNRVLPQSDYYASIRIRDNLSNIETQSYAFQPIYKETEFNQISKEKVLTELKSKLELLREKDIIPYFDYNFNTDVYEANLYSAIDVLEPKKSVSVWQVDLASSEPGALNNGLISCLVDAQTFNVYSFSIRTDKSWDYYEPDEIIKAWSEYLGTSLPSEYLPENPLMEDTPHFKKYSIEGMDGDKTIITVGFFEGVNEFFVKISK